MRAREGCALSVCIYAFLPVFARKIAKNRENTWKKWIQIPRYLKLATREVAVACRGRHRDGTGIPVDPGKIPLEFLVISVIFKRTKFGAKFEKLILANFYY